jgi:hypothetical protein
VARMRELQKRYFATKEQGYLERAKMIEREIDGDLLLIQANANQLNLMLGEQNANSKSQG